MSETYYPTPVDVDHLPEVAGDSWNADPSWVWANYPTCITFEEQSISSSTSCWYDYYTYQYCADSANTLNYADYGATSLPSQCDVGPSIPTTANDVRETNIIPYLAYENYSNTTDFYNVDGIGTVCATYYDGEDNGSGVFHNYGYATVALQSFTGNPRQGNARRTMRKTETATVSLTPALSLAALHGVDRAHMYARMMCNTINKHTNALHALSSTANGTLLRSIICGRKTAQRGHRPGANK
jgi:hypothetical protein